MAVVLGVMILVHEFGHFALAKLLGVRVEQFAIGFGKRIVGFRKGETDYRINLLPLGGYVKMAGENPSESRTGDPGEFMSHPRWHRFLIAIAGPAMNIVLAVVLLTIVYMVHYAHPAYLDQPAIVGWVLDNSAAERAGLEAGDRIVRIENTQNPTWEDVMSKLMLNPGQPVNLAIQRGNSILNRVVTPDKAEPEQFDNAGLLPDEPLTITQLEANMPAAKAGFRLGDEVVAVNGAPVHSMSAIVRMLQEVGNKPAVLRVLRAGAPVDLTVTPVLTQVDGRTAYRIGFQSNPVRVDSLPLPKAFARSLRANRRNSLLIVELVEKMIERKVSMKQVAGPIGIGVAAGEAAEQGLMPFMALAALISLNLGIFNLLPIPIMDGGLVLLLAVESIIRRDISQPVKERIYQAAFVFLVLFGVIVIYNDLMRTLPGLASHLP
jgi:regulator of sigma E protease